MSNIQIWQSPNGINIPTNVSESKEIVAFAKNLSEKQKKQIVDAFDNKAYDMASEYAWKKAMVKLKETIATLGMKFIGEMLGRPDIDEYPSIDTILNDYTTIQLAVQLGVIGNTAAIKLKQANELLSHYFSKNSDEEIDELSATQIIKTSVQYILGEMDISINIEFSKFRERLLKETLTLNDPQVEQFVNSPLFYLRTVISILMSSIKSDKGARLEHTLANTNLLIANIWQHLAEKDKWNIGTAYRDVTAAGNTIATSGLKNALLKVGGFDYVPENLRSVTFKKAAKTVIDTHFAFNNFYNEPPVVKKLASLGSTIPSPALSECIQAYLVVYLGNTYGISYDAAEIANQKLSEITLERWAYYFRKVIQHDDVILNKLREKSLVQRLAKLLIDNRINDMLDLPNDNKVLFNAIKNEEYTKVKKVSEKLYNVMSK